MKGTILLEDGSCYEGISIGVPGEKAGRIMMNTAVVGYQEMMTDPSNAGKILILTYPLVGNYGVAKKFNESGKCWLSALIINEMSAISSNFQSETTLNKFIISQNLITAGSIDTRTLALKIRESGELFCIVSTKTANKTELMNKLKSYKKEPLNDFISKISTPKPKKLKGKPSAPFIAVLDLGMSNSFIKQLRKLGCNILLLPYNTTASDILKIKPGGLVISNGPEEDAVIPQLSAAVKALLGKIPMMGISTGHEIICLALGAKLKKMKAGHRGVNYPVTAPGSFKGEITVQNHSYSVDEASLKKIKSVKVTLKNLNDNTVEEFESKLLRILSVQYYPSCPGFNEVNNAFIRFLSIVKGK